jgi:hypothetical protein
MLIAFFISAYTYKMGEGTAVEPLIIKDSTSGASVNSCNDVCVMVNSEQVVDSFYSGIFQSEQVLNKKVFNYALKGYFYLLNQGTLQKKDTLTIIDYSLSSNQKRLWVVDLRHLKVLFHELVAHGKNSGNEYARKFSNTSNSFQSSLGFFLTGDIYAGKHETSLRLFGVENKFNSKAFERGIVIHGADYVSESFIRNNQRLGRSQGCPAVSENVINNLVQTISNGACVFAYYPYKTYLKNSNVLKG